MRISTVRLLLLTLVVTFGGLAAAPATAQPEVNTGGSGSGETATTQDGFLWHDNGAAGATYPGDGSSAKRFNPTGEDIVVSRTGTGLYTVAVSATDQSFIPTVTASSTVGNHCKVGSFLFPGTIVTVRCYDSGGTLTDEEFTLRWTTTAEDATLFVAADGIFSCCGTNPWGGAATVAKTGVGTYRVTVPGGPNFEQGHVQVTAYGFDASHCTVGDVTGTAADVNCFESDGDPIDSSFTFLRIGSADDAYVWADNPASTTVYTPDADHSHNPQGVDPTSVRTARGRYTVAIPGHLVSWGGSVAVTARGSSPAKCAVDTFEAQLVTVACTNASGNPANSAFNLLYTRFQVCNGVPANIEIGNDVPTAGDDVIIGTGGNDAISALDGDDLVCGSSGDDTIIGGPGNDTIFGQGGKDLLSGNAGNDIIDAGGGADSAFGGSGNDVITGGFGDDVLGGSSGFDLISGQDGADTISGGSDADGLISGGEGNDAVNGGGGPDNNVTGDNGDDTVSGNGGDDTITGGPGADEVRGGQGDDLVLGGDGDDFVAGNTGTDTCDGQAGTDTAASNCETVLNVP